MLSIYIAAVALQTQAPYVPLPRALYFAAGIVEAVEARELPDEDELEQTAAAIVNGERESRWRYDVETCKTVGIQGLGTFGVGPLYAGQYPGGTCGPIAWQARASVGILLAGEGATWRETFGRYIGARSRGRHPEAVRRERVFWRVLQSLKCACSDFA